MKPYGVQKADAPVDCTDTGKFGVTKLAQPCACGAKHGKSSKDHKSRKAKARQENKIGLYAAHADTVENL